MNDGIEWNTLQRTQKNMNQKGGNILQNLNKAKGLKAGTKNEFFVCRALPHALLLYSQK